MVKSWGCCKDKTENQRQEAYGRILRTSENFWIQGTLIYRSSWNTSTPTLKPSTTQGPTSFRSRHTTQILQQHNSEPQYAGWPKSHQTHWHLKTYYWTLHCTPERRNPAPSTRTLTQASLTRKTWQATHPTPHTVRNFHNKEEPPNARIQITLPQTEQSKQNEKAEKYPESKGTG